MHFKKEKGVLKIFRHLSIRHELMRHINSDTYSSHSYTTCTQKFTLYPCLCYSEQTKCQYNCGRPGCIIVNRPICKTSVRIIVTGVL